MTLSPDTREAILVALDNGTLDPHDTLSNGEKDALRRLCRPRILARFEGQAWVNDYALPVDPEGDTEWDATEGFADLPVDYQTWMRAQMYESTDGEVVDNDDLLQSDPNAPRWVRDWHGPFTIWIWEESP